MSYFLLVGISALAITYLLVPSCRAIAIRFGFVAGVRDRDVHVVPIPYLGGVAIYAGLWAGYFVALAAPAPSFIDKLALSEFRNILLCCGLIFVVGLLDDAFDLPALAKFAAQVLTGTALASLGIRLYTVPTPGGGQWSLSEMESIAVSVFFVVAASNAFNFIDGLDGLAAGVAFAGGISLVIYSVPSLLYSSGLGASTPLVGVVIAGSCVGFYAHNSYPARIFMGDAGALTVGAALGAAAVVATQLTAASSPQAEGFFFGSTSRLGFFLWIMLPLAIVGIPLIDLLLAVARRLIRRESIFAPDKAHLHHLALRGRTHASASFLLTSWAFVISCGSAWIVVDPSVGKVVAVSTAGILVLVLSIYPTVISMARLMRAKAS